MKDIDKDRTIERETDIYTVQLPKTDNAWDQPIWSVLRGVGFRKF